MKLAVVKRSIAIGSHKTLSMAALRRHRAAAAGSEEVKRGAA
jgi:hypothetical protein